MFSSLASYFFGSNTDCETNSEANSETSAATVSGEATNERDSNILLDTDNLLEVELPKPSSVTGDSGWEKPAIKRGKNKRKNACQQNKSKGFKNNNAKATSSLLPTLTTSQAKLPGNLTSISDEEFDEDEWFIVEKEEEKEDDSSTHTNFEGENEVVKATEVTSTAASNSLDQEQCLQHINSHSLYSKSRPQKKSNFLPKTRKNNNKRSSGLSVSTLSPSRTVGDGRNASGLEATADGCMTRSLYVPSSVEQSDDNGMAPVADAIETNNKMDESWFVTPPPCFTSIGPVNMEISPYENLLIEHPSMSVYYSIKAAQEAVESFVKLDIGSKAMAEKQKANETTPKKKMQAVQQRFAASSYRLDRQSVAQLKQELMARSVQKIQTKNERKELCRSAIKRTNKVRDVQSRNHTQRRSERQHCKLFSNANNNRKTNCI